MVEHPTYRDAVDVGTLDTEADDAAGEHVHDDQHPVAAQQDGFAAEQVDAPQAVLDVPDECQPGGAVGSGVAWPIAFREHATHDILVDVDAESTNDLLGDADTAGTGLRRFISTIAAMSLRKDLWGQVCGDAGRGVQEEQVIYFRSTKTWWNLSSVAGLTSAPSFAIRRGLTNGVHTPGTTRSRVVRFGAPVAGDVSVDSLSTRPTSMNSAPSAVVYDNRLHRYGSLRARIEWASESRTSVTVMKSCRIRNFYIGLVRSDEPL